MVGRHAVVEWTWRGSGLGTHGCGATRSGSHVARMRSVSRAAHDRRVVRRVDWLRWWAAHLSMRMWRWWATHRGHRAHSLHARWWSTQRHRGRRSGSLAHLVRHRRGWTVASAHHGRSCWTAGAHKGWRTRLRWRSLSARGRHDSLTHVEFVESSGLTRWFGQIFLVRRGAVEVPKNAPPVHQETWLLELINLNLFFIMYSLQEIISSSLGSSMC